MSAEKYEKMKYEEALSRLREVVGKLESGEETLESSLALFEEGSALSAVCYKKLKDAEQRVQTISGEVFGDK